MPGGYPCCCQVPTCEACKDNIYPDNLAVTIRDMSNGGGCTDCTDLNDETFILPKTSNCVGTSPGVQGVTYSAEFPAYDACTCGGYAAVLVITLIVQWNFGGVVGTRRVSISIGNHAPGTALYCYIGLFDLIETAQSEPFDCDSWGTPDPLILPYTDCPSGFCNSSAATVEVEAA